MKVLLVTLVFHRMSFPVICLHPLVMGILQNGPIAPPFNPALATKTLLAYSGI